MADSLPYDRRLASIDQVTTEMFRDAVVQDQPLGSAASATRTDMSKISKKQVLQPGLGDWQIDITTHR